ncbi:peptidase S41 [Shewanella sp. NFH-SH190041]|uniref:S41 family peptidase n=1 Tax=Shewanella sp. NFH-SH190041 TaxID=2950245 RepID=UPI0021C274F7|nr:S41 family peptidase [Shewanella sp. NFH-SH190041]BDM65876.1 peptidase S41 [Shewanella sp. NFH-SH190041]
MLAKNKTMQWTGVLFSLGLLTACGGSDGDSPAVSAGPNWTAGQYQPAEDLINFCAAPRSGTDPYTNQPYPDKSGSSLYEKLYLRSFSHETYLWYNELPDPNPNSSPSVQAYFDLLTTSATTDSGARKDRFHFTVSYDDYMQESQSGTIGGYGFNWAFIQTTPPRNLTVSYTESNSPAALQQVQRGDRLLKVNGIDVISSNDQTDIDQLNTALFSPALGSNHRFTLQRSDGSDYEVTLTAEQITLSPVQLAKVIQHDNKKVGYVQFNQFISIAQDGLIEAFNLFANNGIDELVLDMRYNGGGLIYQSAQLGFMVAGANSRNRIFETLKHNDKQENLDSSIQFEPRVIDWSQPGFTDTQLPSAQLNRVYILTTAGTASASESLINGLRGIDVEVIQIGSATQGKPYGFIPQPNCGNVYFTIQFKGDNEKGFGDFADGFIPTPAADIVVDTGLNAQVPGCTVADDFSQALGHPQERLLAAALQYMTDGTCPAPRSQMQHSRSIPTSTGPALMMPFHPLRHGSIYSELNHADTSGSSR